jgi:hypothetical protein
MALKMEVIRSSEKSVHKRTTRSYISEYGNIIIIIIIIIILSFRNSLWGPPGISSGTPALQRVY